MRTFLIVALMLLAIVFAVQNATVVTVTALFWRFDASLAIVVAICFAGGALGGALVTMPRLYRMRAHEKRLRAQLADLGVDALHDVAATPTSSPGAPQPVNVRAKI